jgi:dGTPase
MPVDLSRRRHHRFYGDYTENPEFEFGKDYDHILYSSAFRRLGGVTQVVSANETALFHNRMTHSLKVAQVGRRLTRALREQIEDEGRNGSTRLADIISRYGGGLDTRVVHAACIAHDLGHPPFGHIAEQALQDLLSSHPDGNNGNTGRLHPQIGDPVALDDSFEGNAQTFRIVTKLAFRESIDQRNAALNLTRATLAALLKYPWSNRRRPTGVKERNTLKKWGYYDSEREFFEFARDGLIVEREATAYSNPRKEFRTIEAQIMDWSDDISYAIHDVEDFFRAGIIPLDVLGQSDQHFNDFYDYAWDRIESQFVMDDASQNKRSAAKLTVAGWLEDVRELLPSTPYAGTRSDREALHGFASATIRDATRNLTITDAGLLLPEKRELAVIEVFKQLTWYYVIDRTSLSSGQHGQVYLIRELFRDLTSWVSLDYDQRRQNRKSKVLPPRLKDYVDIALDPDSTIGCVDYEVISPTIEG